MAIHRGPAYGTRYDVHGRPTGTVTIEVSLPTEPGVTEVHLTITSDRTKAVQRVALAASEWRRLTGETKSES